MNSDPRVQKFYDEADAAKKELRRLAVEIAGWRIDHADLPVFAVPKAYLNAQVVPDVVWALENGRTDIAARIIEMVDQYNNSLGTAAMMQVRVDAELHQKSVRSMEEGDLPDYLDEDDTEGEPIRISAEEAAALFGSAAVKP